jgi:hypothetical protein
MRACRAPRAKSLPRQSPAARRRVCRQALHSPKWAARQWLRRFPPALRFLLAPPFRRVLRFLLALPFRQAPQYRLFLPVLH